MKKILSFLLAIVLIVSLAACGNNASSESKTDNNNQTPQAETTNPEPTPTPAPTPAPTPTPTPEPTPEPTPTPTPEPTPDPTPVLTIGETVTSDKYEFIIDYINITNDVYPPSPAGYYHHYIADNGKTYLDLCIAYKNTDTGNIGADKVLTGKLLYADKYEFSGFTVIEEDNRGDFTYANITNISPLTTEYLHYLFELPEEIATSSLGITLRINVRGTEYAVIYRENSEDAEPLQEAKEGKTSGEIVDGEVIATKNTEFFVDYSNITNDVMPRSPSSYYHHYQADSGKTYVDFCVAYKNTSGKSVVANNAFSAKLKYADKYDFTGFSIIEEENRGDFTYTNITSIAPLTMEYVHYLFEVPEEVGNSSDSVVVTLTIDGNTYTYSVR